MIEIKTTGKTSRTLKVVASEQEAKEWCNEYFRRMRNVLGINKKIGVYWVNQNITNLKGVK